MATPTPLPPTPGPPTPTPALPEEGGPSSGVLGGYVYVDADGDGRRSAGDGALLTTIHVVRVVSSLSDIGRRQFPTNTDNTGHWESRGLPDGSYVVSSSFSPRDPNFDLRPIPPPSVVETAPGELINDPNYVVQIVGANRILNLDFGIRQEPPVAGVRLPNTGVDSRGSSAIALTLTAAAVVVSAAGFGGLALGRRRRARAERA